MIRKALLAFFVITAVFAILATTRPEPDSEKLYFPICVGDRREYTDLVTSIQSTQVVTSVEKKDNYWVVTESMPAVEPLPAYQITHQVSQSGILFLGDTLFGKAKPSRPDLKLTPDSKLPTPGTVWEAIEPNSVPGNSAKFIFTIGDEEEVNVSAGKFKAVKVESRSSGEVAGKSLPEITRLVTWYAKRVGAVKILSIAPNGKIIGNLELKSFTAGKG